MTWARHRIRTDTTTKRVHIAALWLFRTLVCSLHRSAIHWLIDWTSDTNFLSGNYVSKELISRLVKLDNILKKKIGVLDSEIETNFMILMAITAVMGIILVMAAHTCYLSCKQKIDTVVPTKPNVSRIPVIRERHLPVIREKHVPVITSNSQNKLGLSLAKLSYCFGLLVVG